MCIWNATFLSQILSSIVYDLSLLPMYYYYLYHWDCFYIYLPTLLNAVFHVAHIHFHYHRPHHCRSSPHHWIHRTPESYSWRMLSSSSFLPLSLFLCSVSSNLCPFLVLSSITSWHNSLNHSRPSLDQPLNSFVLPSFSLTVYFVATLLRDTCSLPLTFFLCI